MSNEVVHDPNGLLDAEIPLDREPHMMLVKTVLALPAGALPPGDLALIALQLTGHAAAVAADVRLRSADLPEESRARVLTDVVLGEADRRLAVRPYGSLACAQNRARLVRALYERLDALDRTTVPVVAAAAS